MLLLVGAGTRLAGGSADFGLTTHGESVFQVQVSPNDTQVIVATRLDSAGTIYWSLVADGGMGPKTAEGIVLWVNGSKAVGERPYTGGLFTLLLSSSVGGVMPGVSYDLYLTV